MSIEQTILSSIIDNEEYSRRVLPHIKPEYFQNEQDKQAFILIKSFFDKYNKPPTKQALLVDLDSVENISETVYKGTYDLITGLPKSSETTEWLVDKTEKFCQDKALYNAILESIQIMDNKKSDTPKTAIPKILQDALAVSLDTKLGHDYLEDAESRFDFYHNKVSRIPFDIEILNKITKGGVPKKTLNIILSPTNTGKTLIMCHMAAAYLKEGKNVLYITLEMAEEEISKRIDANLLNVQIDDLMLIDKSNFISSIQRIKSKYKGRLKVVEYPTSTASAAHFRHLLSELKAKEEFIPDVIFIDYINLCASSRLKSAAVANTFLVVKSVAEEIRGLAVESLATIWSATQTTRTGLSNSDLELGDVSESIALASTCDFMLGVTQSEQLAELGQYSCKQLKNRYGDKNYIKRFFIGVDKPKMRLYDIDQDEAGPIEDKPVMDTTEFGEQDYNRKKPKSKFGAGRFELFK